VLAIDQGTTGTTALLIDVEGSVTGRGYAELPQHFPQPGWVEHDGEEIWDSVLQAVHTAIRSDPSGGVGIAGIGITNQRETTLVWDRFTSRPIAPAIVWQDRRTAPRCDALRRAGRARNIRLLTGLEIDPYFSATKLEWLLEKTPGAKARAQRGDLAFGTVDSWLLWRLTAGAVHATDFTNASRTMLFDIARREWSDTMLSIFRVPRSMLPRALPSVDEFGETRDVPGLEDGIPIRGIAGDQQAALFGHGRVAAGGLKNTYGTGCFLMLHTGTKRVASKSGLLTTLACGPRGEAAYALEGSIFVAGAAIQWLRDGLGILEHAAESEALARSVPDAGGTYLVPAFTGLGAPHWRADARGIWCGLTRGVTRAHLARAALESIAYQTLDVVDVMAKETRNRPRALRVDGGATQNDFLMQFQADILGIPIERPEHVELTALGAAHLAGIGIGMWEKGGAIPGVSERLRAFRPEMPRVERERCVSGWRKAVSMLLRSGPGARASRSSKR
jgi:glycerol kinase